MWRAGSRVRALHGPIPVWLPMTVSACRNVDFEVDLPFFTLNHAGQGISNDDAQTGSAYASGNTANVRPDFISKGQYRLPDTGVSFCCRQRRIPHAPSKERFDNEYGSLITESFPSRPSQDRFEFETRSLLSASDEIAKGG